MLQLSHVTKTYRSGSHEVRAVDDVSLSLAAGRFMSIEGPSGCGKTTLLLAAGGLLSPDSGRVTVNGQELYGLAADERAGFRAAHIGFVFQQFFLVPYLSVLENVLAASIATGQAGAKEKARDILSRFGLEHRLHHVPAELSTGEKQRTALARALFNGPQLVLADEPTGNLDDANGRMVLAALREFAADGGAVLLVSHDRQAVDYADEVQRIHDGRLVVDGATVR